MDKFLSTREKPQSKTIIRVQDVHDLPEGAVRMSDEDVLHHHLKMIRKWENPSQIWPLRHGLGIMTAAASIGGFVVNAHFRQKFKLRNFGRLSSYLPAVCLPAMMSALFHQTLIINPILLGDYTCTMCIETRSGVLNTCLGALYPLAISPISCIVLARKFYTIPVPKITEAGRLFSLLRKTSPTMGGLFLLIAGQFFLGMFMAEREITTFHNFIARSQRDLEKDEEIY